MVKKIEAWVCEICGRQFASEDEALACEARSVPPFAVGDHIALNGEEPSAGVMGFVRWIGEATAHSLFVVLARTDAWKKYRDTTGGWLCVLDGGEKIVPPPEGVTPEEPPWERMPDWVRRSDTKEAILPWDAPIGAYDTQPREEYPELTVAGVRFSVLRSGDCGIHSGRDRFHVRCLDCEETVHPRTTGPGSLIRGHLQAKHGFEGKVKYRNET